jgi:hypothetical protein
MSEKFKKVVQMFNDGEWDETLQPHFETIENFLNIIDKAGLTEMIDPFSYDLEDVQNEILYNLLQTPKKQEILNKIIEKYLSDISIENGKIMCDFRSMSDLSEFFDSGRSRVYDYEAIVKKQIDGDYGDYFFDDTTDNVYRDVIEELNPENLNYLKGLILKKLNGVQVELDGRSSDWMEEEAQRQGHEEYIIIDNSNIDNVLKDEDTMLWLLDNDLSDIESELNSIHRNAYESAYSSEVYNNFVNEINEYFVWNNKDEYKYGDKYRFKIEVRPGTFENVIEEYLYNHIGYSENLVYHGNFESLFKTYLKEGDGLLTFRVPDYPDSREVDKMVNEYFGDYL